MNPQDNLPGPDNHWFLDEWENEAEKQFDPLAKNPLDPLSDMLDAAEQQIEGTAPISPTPPDMPPDVLPDETGREKEEAPSDNEKDKDKVDLSTSTEEGSVDIGPSWGTINIRSRSPLGDIHHGRGYRPYTPPARLSRGRGGAGLGHSSSQRLVWCPEQQELVNIEDCQDCEYYEEGEENTEGRCTQFEREYCFALSYLFMKIISRLPSLTTLTH